jgi:hypothetical protein
MNNERSAKLLKAREAADSVEPGMERSRTPGTVKPKKIAARSAGFKIISSTIPGVSLRFTPGFMLSTASRAGKRQHSWYIQQLNLG